MIGTVKFIGSMFDRLFWNDEPGRDIKEQADLCEEDEDKSNQTDERSIDIKVVSYTPTDTCKSLVCTGAVKFFASIYFNSLLSLV